MIENIWKHNTFQYFSDLMRPPDLASSTGPDHSRWQKHWKRNGFIQFCFESVRKHMFFNVLRHSNRRRFKTAGEVIHRPGNHPAGHPAFTILGLHFLIAFRCGGVTNKNWLWGPRHQISLTKRKGTERSRFCEGGRAAQIPEKCNTDATQPRSKRKSPPMPDEATETLAPPGSGSRRS